MKKNYIAPKSNVYAVRTCEMIAMSLDDNNAQGPALVKEEKQEQGSGIWDLY